MDKRKRVTLKLLSLVPFVSFSSQARASTSPVQRIAFGSCAFQWLDQPIWNAVNESDPDLFLFLGDAIYGDFNGENVFPVTRESLLRDWATLGDKPGFMALREMAPVLATWDNHDYGHHNGGVEFESKEIARTVFLDFFGESTGSMRRQRDGIYDAKIIGPEGKRLQVIMLDNRWNRGPLIPDTRSDEERAALGISGSMGHTPNDDPSVTLLGKNQWKWLEEQLTQPSEVRLICSGTQIVNDAKGMQEWGNFPHERKRLFDLVGFTGAKGVILLSGNVHYTEISKTDEGRYPLYDFTSSGMTHNSTTYAEFANPYRVSGPYTENNFGLVEINWNTSPSPEINMQAVSKNGTTIFKHFVSLADLQ